MASKKKTLTKAQLFKNIAADTGLTQAQVDQVFAALEKVIKSELKSSGTVSALPGLLKIKKVDKPMRKARMGRNPATGEQMMFKAKPASKGVRCTALKGLKEMV